MRAIFLAVLLILSTGMEARADETTFLTRIPLSDGHGVITTPADGRVYFLRAGEHSYEPTPGDVLRQPPIVIAPFQQLAAVRWDFPPGESIRVSREQKRDAFWDQVLAVHPGVLRDPPKYRIVETGTFGESLPTPPSSDPASQTDPIIPAKLDREMSWDEIAGKAYPLDFQKVLLGSINDPAPAFAFQNGQWLTTWLSRDLPKWNKEDHWFAPALLIGEELVRPAPLSARTGFVTTSTGVTVPMWTLEWSHGGATVQQEMFSHRLPTGSEPRLFVRVRVTNAPPGAKLALGMGRRPNVHWWDDRSRERSPIAFYSLSPKYRRDGRRVLDHAEHVVLESSSALELQPLGPVEMLAIFDELSVDLVAPQSEATEATADYESARRVFLDTWSKRLRIGAQVRLPSSQWMQRIDIWRSQVASITRVNYQHKERLSYGAYFYQYYFGIEEGWPVVASALWGDADEAKRQAQIMLEPENLAKDNVHHQSRNGAAAWSAAAVARLTRDRDWLRSIAPRLIDCARWTQRVRNENAPKRSPLTRGLLPAHIYGGDVRDPATSLYSTVACWRGMVDTAAAFRELGDEALVRESEWMEVEAKSMQQRIDEVIHNIKVDGNPPFLPFALELPSLGGKHEGPHDRLTATRFGNYWNLFAPSFLELNYACADDPSIPNRWIYDYMTTHGGTWAGLPRFYSGLDAVYARGCIEYLLQQSARDVAARHRALAGLQSFFLHAASRNGYTIPEVAGLFPYRFDRAAYEQMVRQSPWNFGMYDANRYLQGHISFTEPLGAGAGEALWMIRNALVIETPDALVVLPTVPGDWFDEGKIIALKDFPTLHGTFSATIRSHIKSHGTIDVEYDFKPLANSALKTIRLRFVPTGYPPKEIEVAARGQGAVNVRF